MRVDRERRHSEQVILGVILFDNRTLRVVRSFLEPDDFCRAHRVIYEAVLRLDGRGEAIDVITLSKELRAEQRLEAAGGHDSLAAIIDAIEPKDFSLFRSLAVVLVAKERTEALT